MSAMPLERVDVHYPESDGQPMAETDIHRDEMFYFIEALRDYFRGVPDVYVSGNLFLYYVKGDPRFSVSPDVLVAKGLRNAKEPRPIYKAWEEERLPCWVLEVTSKKSQADDLRKKKDLYERLGVEEYFVHDPLREYLRPPLQGFRLSSGRYQPLKPEKDGSFFSQTLGLSLRPEGRNLWLIDPRTGLRFPTPGENAERATRETAARKVAEERADREADARRALEEEVARLRLDVEQLSRSR